jgi:hypothetical protein
MSGTPTIVTLGDAEVPVYPQRHAYLQNKVGKWMQSLVDNQGDLNTADALAFLGGNAYEVLSVMIPSLPKRIPRWQWDGYGSAEAAEAGEYDEEQDSSPTIPQIVEAFNTAVAINRFDVFKAVLKVVDPTMLRNWINAQMAEWLTSNNSLNSSGTSTDADQTSSGTTAPTSTASAD